MQTRSAERTLVLALGLACSVNVAVTHAQPAPEPEPDGVVDLEPTPRQMPKAMDLDSDGIPDMVSVDFARKTAAEAADKAIKDEKNKEAKGETADALAATTTVPQFAARRGGTLGIPAASARDGLQAAIDILNSEKTANAFVKLEGVELTSRFHIAVVAETFEESLPRTVIGMPPATTELFVAKIPSVGARATWSRNALFTVSAFQSEECIAELNKLDPTQYKILLGLDGNGTKDDDPVFQPAKEKCNVTQLGDRSQRVYSAGVRVLRRGAAKGEGQLADGLAGEIAYLQERSNHLRLMSFYASPSFLWLQKGQDEIAGTMIELPEIFEARVSAGFEYRGTKVLDANTAPRAGVYGTAAWNWWTNEYNFGTVARDIRGSQFEAGIYFSARVGGGVHGLISLSVLEPFGNEDGRQVLLSFSQSASSNGTPPAGAAGDGE